MGTVISAQTIVNTPLISRNPIALTLLAPGVTTPNPSGFNTGVRTTGGGRPYVNGNREEGNNFLLDGVDNNQTSDNLTSYQPNLDAIAEFKMITNNASAEFGNFQGGIINMVIKSGTNQFHGNVFEDFRNDKLNANNWARNWTVGQNFRSPIRWNQFGGTFGGPIKKDKLFFFADYQGLRRATPPSVSATTRYSRRPGARATSPTCSTRHIPASPAAFSSTTPSRSNDHRRPRALRQQPDSAQPVQSGGQEAVCESDALSAADARRRARSPTPTTSTPARATSSRTRAISNWTRKPPIRTISARGIPTGARTARRQHAPFLYNSFNIAPFQNGVINWTRTISPTLVNEARVGVNNIMLNNGGEDKGLGDIASKLGIQNAGAGLLSLQGFAYTSSLGNANIGTQQLFATTTYHYADNLTMIRGRHMMKMGAKILRQQMNVFYSGNNGRTGYINFSGRFTAANAINPDRQAGGRSRFRAGPADRLRPRPEHRHLGPAQDHLRLLLPGRLARHQQPDPQSRLALGVSHAAGRGGGPAGELRPVHRRNSNSPARTATAARCTTPYKKDFQPRVGFAYTPDILSKKMVVRGAYTISSFMEGTGTNLRLPLNPPFDSEYTSALQHAERHPARRHAGPGPLRSEPNADPFKGATIRLWDPERPSGGSRSSGT